MNLLCWIPMEHDATSFYRALQPISQLRHIVPDLNIFHVPKEINMIHIAHMDVVFLQRPTSEAHLELIDMCKNLGVKVWVEYDDNLFCVPASNPAHAAIQNDKTQKVLKDILLAADVISVSTAQLARDIAKQIECEPKHIHVIPNAFNDYLFKDQPVFKPHNIVMWRGTQSHQYDLHIFSPHILSAAKKNPMWLFNFMGYNPFYLTEALPKQSIHIEPMEIFKYHKMIKSIYPNLFMVTLSDTEFNRCKSNIAWIEATYAGGVTLGPTWEEWEKPGIINYKTPEGFGERLDQLLSVVTEKTAEHMHRLSWEYIQNNLKLSKVNRMRAALLESLR